MRYFISVACCCHLTQNTPSDTLKWALRVGISSGREQLMNDHPFWRTGDQKRVRPPQAPSVVAPWGSFAARAAVHRTCYEVTLRCQRVLARYSPGEDKLKHVAVGDPDPVPAHGYWACRFEWADEVSTGFVLLWCCTRAQGHHGQHLAGTGERVAAVHSNSVQGHFGCRGEHERHRTTAPRGIGPSQVGGHDQA